jgi:Fe-S-cluster containining protein
MVSVFSKIFNGVYDSIKLDCKKCGGLCCSNPPELYSLEEVERALKNGASVMYCNIDNNKMYFVVKAIENKCPFLDKKDFNCSIYEERFEACKKYECEALKNNNKINGIDFFMLEFLKNNSSKATYQLVEENDRNIKTIERLKKTYGDRIQKSNLSVIVKTNNVIDLSNITDQLEYTIKNITK